MPGAGETSSRGRQKWWGWDAKSGWVYARLGGGCGCCGNGVSAVFLLHLPRSLSIPVNPMHCPQSCWRSTDNPGPKSTNPSLDLLPLERNYFWIGFLRLRQLLHTSTLSRVVDIERRDAAPRWSEKGHRWHPRGETAPGRVLASAPRRGRRRDKAIHDKVLWLHEPNEHARHRPQNP